jgi:hypothetical protein
MPSKTPPRKHSAAKRATPKKAAPKAAAPRKTPQKVAAERAAKTAASRKSAVQKWKYETEQARPGRVVADYAKSKNRPHKPGDSGYSIGPDGFARVLQAQHEKYDHLNRMDARAAAKKAAGSRSGNRIAAKKKK